MGLRIVCAALKHKGTGQVVVGVRHFDTLMAQYTKALPYSQGFIDNRCVFHSRTEAWKIAEAAGQILRRVGGDIANGGTLYSENLY